jgi:hypothetical protein
MFYLLERSVFVAFFRGLLKKPQSGNPQLPFRTNANFRR